MNSLTKMSRTSNPFSGCPKSTPAMTWFFEIKSNAVGTRIFHIPVQISMNKLFHHAIRVPISCTALHQAGHKGKHSSCIFRQLIQLSGSAVGLNKERNIESIISVAQ